MNTVCNAIVSAFLLSLCASTFGQAPAGQAAQPADQPPPPDSAYALPHNYYGAHLLVDSGSGKGEKHLRWARYLVGRWGHAKTLLMGIDRNTRGPGGNWVNYVNKCYELELIPFLRLGGRMENGMWIAPKPDAPGDYTSMAKAVKRVVEGFPRSDKCPLYIELWNEPNLSVEWTGKPNHEEYAAFFVQVAKAIREIGDPRIKILNGGLATSPDWAEKLCKAEPDFINLFDFWSCHPYPGNRPSWINHHDRNAPAGADMIIDGYLLELDVLKRMGAKDVRVMITETGYDLGNSLYTRGEGHPIIDEYNRADYMVRAFRDYYPKWPEVAAVFPFEFCNEGWERFDWVYPDSDINADGSPTRPHYQYLAVAALAKPTDTTGAINGTITVADLGMRLEGVTVTTTGGRFISDPMGNYFLPRLKPGTYRVKLSKTGFKDVTRELRVTAATNTVLDVAMEATRLETVSGKVRDGDTDRPLRDVKVTLEPGGLTAKTNSDGEYMIRDVVPARYRLIAEADGRNRYEAENVSVTAGRNNTWDFVLGKQADRLPGENLINNPGIEAGGGGGAKPGIALSFEPYNPMGADEKNTQIEERIAHTGRRSQKMRVLPEETIIRQITHYGTANPGERYVAGVWIRTEIPDRNSGAWMTLDFTNNGGGLIERVAPKEKVEGRSRGWVWVQVEGVAPHGAQRVSVNFHTQGRGGFAYFDDAYLGQVVRKK